MYYLIILLLEIYNLLLLINIVVNLKKLKYKLFNSN